MIDLPAYISLVAIVVIYMTAKVGIANYKQYETLERIRLDGGETAQ